MRGVEHERAFFERFVERSRRGRWLTLLEGAAGDDERRRRRFTDGLNHALHRELTPEWARIIEAARFDPRALAAAVESATGVKELHCFASHSDLDGKTLPALEALAHDQFFGMVLSAVPGRLAFHLPEMGPWKPERFLLMRDLGAEQMKVLCAAIA